MFTILAILWLLVLVTYVSGTIAWRRGYELGRTENNVMSHRRG